MRSRKGGAQLKIHTVLHKRYGNPPVRECFLALVALLLLIAPMPALALEVNGTSRSYLMSREQADGTKLLPGYEYLNLSVTDLGYETLSAHVGGWAGYDFKEKTGDNDLQYGYLSYKSKTANIIVNLGRIMVNEGVAAERVDGIYARTDLLYNFGISAFDGNPVETGNPVDATAALSTGSNSIYGTRLTHQMPGLYRVGVSFLKEEKNSTDFRKEEGLDLWVHPVSKVDIAGHSNYNA